MAITTIPRNHTRRIAQLTGQLTQCRVFTLANYFIAQPVEPHHAWAALGRGASLTDNGNGTYTIRVHSNHWYELTEPHCNHDAAAVRNGACEGGETGCGQCGAEPGEACGHFCTARPDGAPSR